ncbi:MAG TPA: SsrA-binding protein SmpB [Thermoanaerobaculia bacterium]|nr:SsrA-binding protein SmpB [Thermoanaerobaculia bacterium]
MARGGDGGRTLLASNRRARHDYTILETFEAGLDLQGTEVKAARAGKVQLKDSYVEVRGGQAWLVGAHISPYSHGTHGNHDPERDRRLLLHRREIDRLMGRTQIQGQTAVPLSLYLKGNWIKLEVALARGRQLHDKRQAAKERIADREAEEAVRGRGREP